MWLLDRLLDAVGTASRHVLVEPDGVSIGHRLIPLDDVDRFDVEVADRPGNVGGLLSASTDELDPRERLVLLTRSGRTIRIGGAAAGGPSRTSRAA